MRGPTPPLLAAPGDELAAHVDRTVAALLPPVLTGLALVSACLALVQSALPGQPDDPTLLLAKMGASTLFLLGRVVLERWPVPEGRAHLVGTVVAAVGLAVILHQLSVTGEPRETTFLLILVLGAGLAYLDLSWFALLAALVLGGWMTVAGPSIGEPAWSYFGVALLVATVLAATVLVGRIRGMLRLHAFRRQERVRQLELESALEQTERARQGEEEARRALEDALVQVKESEERFRRLADAAFEGVLIFREGRIVDANARAAELFNVSAAQLIGDPAANLVAPADRPQAERFLLTGGGGGADSLQVEGRRYDGSRFPMELSVVDSLLHARPVRVLVIRDVTNQKRVEGVLRRAVEAAESNSRAKSNFLANMSHELRTPLNSVIGFANILSRNQEGRLPEREVDYLRRIVANGKHLLSLIEDILDLSKIDAQRIDLQVEEVPLAEVIHEVVRTLEFQARRKGLRLEAPLPRLVGGPGEGGPAALPVRADRRRLTQVLINLVGNAIKFTEEGGVRIHVRVGSSGRPRRIEVQDTGIGIAAERLEEVFAPFHQVDASRTRAHGGSGLGLAISRSLCRLMGFELGVESEEGRGSTFFVDLEPAAGGARSGRAADPAGSADDTREQAAGAGSERAPPEV